MEENFETTDEKYEEQVIINKVFTLGKTYLEHSPVSKSEKKYGEYREKYMRENAKKFMGENYNSKELPTIAMIFRSIFH